MSGFLYRARFVLDHRWAPARASAYLDGDLAAASVTRMERHLGDCPQCHRLLTELRRVVEGLGRLPAPAGTRDAIGFAASVRRRVGEPPAS
jgi:anti-sigma factor RsiW